MTFQGLKDVVLSSFNDDQLYNDGVFSEAVFKAIRELQKETRCSVFEYVFTPSVASTRIVLAGIPYSLISGDYGYSAPLDGLTAMVHAVYVENIWDETGGTPGTWLRGVSKNDNDRETSPDPETVSVDYDKSGMAIFFNYDVNGKSIRVRFRFVADYVEGEYAIGDKVDLFLNMVPAQFHVDLLEGIRHYFFNALYLQTGRKDFLTQSRSNEAYWREKNIPMVRGEVNEILTDATVYIPRPPRITSMDSDW